MKPLNWVLGIVVLGLASSTSIPALAKPGSEKGQSGRAYGKVGKEYSQPFQHGKDIKGHGVGTGQEKSLDKAVRDYGYGIGQGKGKGKGQGYDHGKGRNK